MFIDYKYLLADCVVAVFIIGLAVILCEISARRIYGKKSEGRFQYHSITLVAFVLISACVLLLNIRSSELSYDDRYTYSRVGFPFGAILQSKETMVFRYPLHHYQEYLDSIHEDARAIGVRAFGFAAGYDDIALDKTVEMIADPSPMVRWAVLTALDEVGPRASVARGRLEEFVMNETDPALKCAAQRILGRLNQ